MSRVIDSMMTEWVDANIDVEIRVRLDGEKTLNRLKVGKSRSFSQQWVKSNCIRVKEGLLFSLTTTHHAICSA